MGMIAMAALVALSSLALTIAASAQPADGLYLSTRLEPGGSLTTRAFLFRGNQVAVGPTGGLTTFDFVAARREDPTRVGTFERAGNQLVIRWASGDSTSGNVRGDPPCFELGQTLFCPVEAFPRGARLQGAFEGGISSARVVRTSVITFKPDGQYTSQRIGTSTEHHSTVAETGRYTLDGNTLTFQPSNGPSRIALTFPYDDGSPGPQPRWLYVDGAMMRRQ